MRILAQGVMKIPKVPGAIVSTRMPRGANSRAIGKVLDIGS